MASKIKEFLEKPFVQLLILLFYVPFSWPIFLLLGSFNSDHETDTQKLAKQQDKEISLNIKRTNDPNSPIEPAILGTADISTLNDYESDILENATIITNQEWTFYDLYILLKPNIDRPKFGWKIGESLKYNWTILDEYDLSFECEKANLDYINYSYNWPLCSIKLDNMYIDNEVATTITCQENENTSKVDVNSYCELNLEMKVYEDQSKAYIIIKQKQVSPTRIVVYEVSDENDTHFKKLYFDYPNRIEPFDIAYDITYANFFLSPEGKFKLITRSRNGWWVNILETYQEWRIERGRLVLDEKVVILGNIERIKKEYGEGKPKIENKFVPM